MAEPEKIDLLLSKADRLQETLTKIENFICAVPSPRRSARSTASQKRDHDSNERPAWFQELMSILDAARKEAHAIRSDALAARTQSNARSELATISANEQHKSSTTNVPHHADLQSGSGTCSAPTSSEREQGSRPGTPGEIGQRDTESEASGSSSNEDIHVADSEHSIGASERESAANKTTSAEEPRGLQPTPSMEAGCGANPSIDLQQSGNDIFNGNGNGISEDDSYASSQGTDATSSRSSIDATDDTTPCTTPAPDTTSLSPKFTLTLDDMGENLVPALGKIMSHPEFANEISVPPPDIDLHKIQDKLNVGDEDCQYTSVWYKPGPKGKGYANIFISEEKSEFDWSGFSEQVEEPTVEKAKEIFETFINNPPKNAIPYYSGHLENMDLNNRLNPGRSILDDSELEDLHMEYHHIGPSDSANRFHCEDATWRVDSSTGPQYGGLCSFNQVYFGYKLWMIIKHHHIAKFDDFTQRKWKHNACLHGLSHSCLLIAPSVLEREGIDFTIVVSKPGIAVATLEGQPHQILNVGPTFARSINYIRPGQTLQLSKVLYCEDDHWFKLYAKYGATCVPPLPKLSSPNRKKLPSKRHAEPETARATTRRCTEVTKRLDEQEQLIKAKDPLCRIPHIDRLDPPEAQVAILEIAASVRSSMAIAQFTNLVREWRRCDVRQVIPVDSGDDLLLHHGMRLKAALTKSCLSQFEVRYAEFRVAHELDKKLRMAGYERRTEAITIELAGQLKIEKELLEDHLEDGKMWKSICRPYDGLLPFILIDSKSRLYITKKRWRGLKVEQREALQSLLDDDYTKNLCRAGKAFQKILTEGSSQVFQWEDGELDLHAADVDSLLHRTINDD